MLVFGKKDLWLCGITPLGRRKAAEMGMEAGPKSEALCAACCSLQVMDPFQYFSV